MGVCDHAPNRGDHRWAGAGSPRKRESDGRRAVAKMQLGGHGFLGAGSPLAAHCRARHPWPATMHLLAWPRLENAVGYL